MLLIFEVNDVCNSRCRYCSAWIRPEEGQNTLSYEEAVAVLDQAHELGVFSISFTGGGEPLLRRDLPLLIEHAKSLGLHVALTTNGYLINEKNVEQLLRADVITVSIDSLDAAVYEEHRGVPGGLQKALHGLEVLLAHNRSSYLCVQSVIDAQSWQEVGKINEYFYRRGVDTVFQPVYNEFFRVPRAVWEEIARNVRFHNPVSRRLFRRYLQRLPEIASGEGDIPCLAGSFAFVVNHQGRVGVCHINNVFAADLRAHSLRDIWHRLAETRRHIASPERNCVCGDTAYIPYSLALRQAK